MSKRAEFESSDTQEMQVLSSVTASSGASASTARKSDEEKVSIFWRLFGGAIISMAALAGFTLYNTLNTSLAELRVENSRLKEDAAAFRTRSDDNRREIDAMKERLNKYRTEMDAAKKDAGTATDGVKKDLTAVEKDLQKALAEVREKLARIEGQQTPMKTVVDK